MTCAAERLGVEGGKAGCGVCVYVCVWGAQGAGRQGSLRKVRSYNRQQERESTSGSTWDN